MAPSHRISQKMTRRATGTSPRRSGTRLIPSTESANCSSPSPEVGSTRVGRISRSETWLPTRRGANRLGASGNVTDKCRCGACNGKFQWRPLAFMARRDGRHSEFARQMQQNPAEFLVDCEVAYLVYVKCCGEVFSFCFARWSAPLQSCRLPVWLGGSPRGQRTHNSQSIDTILRREATTVFGRTIANFLEGELSCPEKL